MRHLASCMAAAALLAVAGTAMAQPAVNGQLKPEYGPIQWFNSTPTGFGDASSDFSSGGCACQLVGDGVIVALNNSNRAGVVGGQDAANTANAAAVTTGVEVKIPLAALGIGPSDPIPTIRIAGLIGNGDLGNASNQWIGGIAAYPTTNDPDPMNPRNQNPNAYPMPSDVDLSLIPGNQYITAAISAGPGPTLDGTAEQPFWPASPDFVQDTNTGYGDATTAGGSLFASPGGSEINGASARIVNSGGDRSLYIMITGNIEQNFNKLAIMIDTGAAGGQNQMRGDNCKDSGVFDGPEKVGPRDGAPGLKFDAGFAANYWMLFTTDGTNMYSDFGKLRTSDADRGWTRNLKSGGQNVTNGNVMTGDAPNCPPPQTVNQANYAGGSEIDGVYSMVCGNFLYVLVTGNLETNGNHLDLFFDVGQANLQYDSVNAPSPLSLGQNKLRNDNVRVDFNGLNRFGPADGMPQTDPSLTFNTAFTADYWVSIINEGSPISPTWQTWAARVNTGGAANYQDAGPNNPASLAEYASFTGGSKSFPTPLSFDGATCVRYPNPALPLACSPTAPGTDGCQPNGLGSPLNPGPTPNYGTDIQGDPFDTPGFLSSTCVIKEPYTSFAPRLMSTSAQDPFNTTGSPDRINAGIPGLLQINIDNSNRGGVTGDSAANARRVTTGIEVRVRLDELGWRTGSPIRLTGFVTSADKGYLSNQVIGSGAGASAMANLADPRNVDFNNVAGGPFYVTLTPGDCATATTAACCFGTECAVMSLAQCSSAGGTFTPGSSTCTINPCAGPTTQNCCRGTTCNSVASGTCTGVVAGSNSLVVDSCGAGNVLSTCCFADFNHDGIQSIDDLFLYFNAYFTASPWANVGGDGVATPTIDDLFLYINAYFSTCQ